jgi:hypothetical protein
MDNLATLAGHIGPFKDYQGFTFLSKFGVLGGFSGVFRLVGGSFVVCLCRSWLRIWAGVLGFPTLIFSAQDLLQKSVHPADFLCIQ